jgi:hypothetical protein
MRFRAAADAVAVFSITGKEAISRHADAAKLLS